MHPGPPPHRRVHLLGHALLAAFAAGIAWYGGSRGFLPLDQSIVFDAGHRILNGQVPYVDFLSPVGPVSFYLQAAAFWTAGVSYSTYIGTAAAMNVVGATTAALLVRHLFPQGRASPWIAGAVTATWLTPPFGTPYPESTTLLLHLLAITLLITRGLDASRGRAAASAASVGCGVVEGLALLAKQNAAAFMYPLFPLLCLLGARSWRDGARALLGVALGAGATIVIFLGWVAWHGAVEDFWRYFYDIPKELGANRLSRSTAEMALLLFEPPHWTVGLLAGSALVGLAAGGWIARASSAQRQMTWQAGVLVSYVYGYQNIVGLTVLNHWAVTLGLAGVVAGSCCGAWEWVLALHRGGRPRRRWLRKALVGLVAAHVAAGLLFLTWRGVRVVRDREVHDIFETSTFTKRAHHESLRSLWWPESVFLAAEEVRPRDVGNLLRYLERQPGRLFVFPDWTIFYGLTGRPAPQPLLWFHAGLTYPRAYDRDLDDRIVSSLEQNDVRIVVLETDAMLYSTRRRLRDFPLLRSYLVEDFQPAQRFGIFSVLLRKDVAPPAHVGQTSDALSGVR